MRAFRRRPAAAAITPLLALVTMIAGCSSDDEPESTVPPVTGSPVTGPPVTGPPVIGGAPIAAGEAPLRIELVSDAVAALEAQLGGPQQYFEVNATPTLVNLFVATEAATAAVAYVYAAGELQEPAEAQPASGPTFTAEEIDFDPTRVLANVVAELPVSTYRVFSVLGTESGAGVRYVVTIESSGGGTIEVPVAADGTILGAG